MAADSSKTEQATPKKREDERKKGNVFQSSDVISAVSIVSLFYTIKVAFPFIYHYMMNFLTPDFVMGVAFDTIIAVFLLGGPMMIVSIAVAILATGVQTGFKISKESIKLKFSNVSFLKGLKRMFSLRSITELLKAMVKISIMAFILYSAFQNIAIYFTQLMYEDITQAMSFILNTIMSMVGP